MENNPIYDIIISDDFIFDYKALLFCLTKFFAEKNGMKMFSQTMLNDIEFESLDEYASKLEINDKENFFNLIKDNELYKTVKPRLLFLFELETLLKNLAVLSIIIISERKDLEVEKLKTVLKFDKIFIRDKFLVENKSYIIFGNKFSIQNFTKQSYLLDKTGKLLSKENLNVYNTYEEFTKVISINYNQTDEYKKQLSEQFIFKYDKKIKTDFKYLSLWENHLNLRTSITIKSKIISGFKRGSKMLGVPTANMEMTEEVTKYISSLVNGVYYGYFKFEHTDIEYKSVLSIGYNPYFDNMTKTIEVYLIEYEGEDFYDKIGQLNILGYLRSEAAFENFSELVTAITYDIIISEKLLTNI